MFHKINFMDVNFQAGMSIEQCIKEAFKIFLSNGRGMLLSIGKWIDPFVCSYFSNSFSKREPTEPLYGKILLCFL